MAALPAVALEPANPASASPKPNARSPLSPRDRVLLVALLLGAALVRAAVIWMPSDQMLEHGGLPFEEVLRGNATYDFQHGTLLPFLDYQLNHFSGGSLVVSVLAVPLFIVGGPLFPVLRLASLWFSIPLVLLTFVLVDRWKGRRAAWTAAALIAFAPPGYQFLNCTVYGTHMEGNLLSIGLVTLYLSWRAAQRGGWVRTFCLGVASGFAVWFGYGHCVVLGVLLLVEVASAGVRSVLGDMPRYALGFLVGLSPWIVNALRYPERLLHIYDRSVVGHFGSGAYTEDKLAVLGNLFVVDGPRSFWFHDANPSVGMIVAHVLFWATVILFGSCMWIERRNLAAFLRALVGRGPRCEPSLRLISLLFISAWLCVFGLSDFRVDSERWIQDCRYLMPLYPFLAILAGTAVGDSPTRKLRWLGTAAIVLVTSVNTAGTVLQLRPDRFAEHAQAPATSNAWQVRMMVRRFGNDPQAMLNILDRIEAKRAEPERSQLVGWIAKHLAQVAASPSEHTVEGGIDTRPYASSLNAIVEQAHEPARSVFSRERDAAVRARAKPQ